MSSVTAKLCYFPLFSLNYYLIHLYNYAKCEEKGDF